MKLKPFDLEAAKRGETVVTRNGREAKFLFFDDIAHDELKVLCVIKGEEGWNTNWVNILGENIPGSSSEEDIFMAPKTKTYYVNVYGVNGRFLFGGVSISEEVCMHQERHVSEKYLKTISFEIEE